MGIFRSKRHVIFQIPGMITFCKGGELHSKISIYLIIMSCDEQYSKAKRMD